MSAKPCLVITCGSAPEALAALFTARHVTAVYDARRAEWYRREGRVLTSVCGEPLDSDEAVRSAARRILDGKP